MSERGAVSKRLTYERTRPQIALDTPPFLQQKGRAGEPTPSVCLFLQKGSNGLRTIGQHSCRPGKAKPFPERFFFIAATETSALLKQRYHLLREGLKTPGIDIHKQVEAVSRALVDPLFHKVDDLLWRADEPIHSATATGDNLTNGNGSILK